ncbi:MAG: PEP-CTERM sorting domain-containing protein [Bryobacteraceae bacterium]
MRLLLLTCMLVVPALSTEIIASGVVSFDVFIPSADQVTGVNAFNIYNFTGPTYGPILGTPYVATSLIFQDATLTLNVQGGSQQVINLGDIAPGLLQDNDGNPVVQFPATILFTSAIFQATLTPTSFLLSDGTTFLTSPSILLNLTPASGTVLVAGTDLAPIYLQSEGSAVPEPGTLTLIGCGLATIAMIRRKQ